MGLTGVAFQQILQVWAQSYTTATNSSLLGNTAVFFSLFLSVLYLNERIRIGKVAGSVIGFAGVALLLMNMNGFLDLGGHALGDGMILAVAFLGSIYMVVGKGVCCRYHPATVVTYVFSLGGDLPAAPVLP
jgi:drug/metabolite transporter (DMT)-like permease